MPDLTSGSVQANGINFHYLEIGEGPLALCMHGFPDHAYSFRHLLPDLAKAGFRGVAPFMREVCANRGTERRPLPDRPTEPGCAGIDRRVRF